jgi:hypothetical protein
VASSVASLESSVSLLPILHIHHFTDLETTHTERELKLHRGQEDAEERRRGEEGGRKGGVYSVQYDASGSKLFSCGGEGTVIVSDVEDNYNPLFTFDFAAK